MENTDGILIAVEGIDGAGKTTQVGLLADALETAGVGVVISKEPTDGQWGQKIRSSAENGRLPVDEELQAFTKDRKEHVREVIRPSLQEGKVVILDRYFYSTIAYQGARGVDIGEVEQKMREIAPVPDMVFLLDVTPRRGLLRIADERGDVPNHFEKEEDLSSVRAIFNKLARIGDEIWKIDGSLSIESVRKTILSLLVDNALKEKRCAKHYGCHDLFHCGSRINGDCQWYNIASSLPLDPIDKQYPGLLSAQ